MRVVTAVVVFATPVYCTSRFCGPVTDMVQELARAYSDRASFIHVEIWQDFEKKELTRAAAEWLVGGRQRDARAHGPGKRRGVSRDAAYPGRPR